MEGDFEAESEMLQDTLDSLVKEGGWLRDEIDNFIQIYFRDVQNEEANWKLVRTIIVAALKNHEFKFSVNNEGDIIVSFLDGNAVLIKFSQFREKVGQWTSYQR